jgi:hypothetical protein
MRSAARSCLCCSCKVFRTNVMRHALLSTTGYILTCETQLRSGCVAKRRILLLSALLQIDPQISSTQP